MSLRNRALTALALLLPASASAQTDAIAHDDTQAVFAREFYVAHANRDGLQAFSAFARRFDVVGGASAIIQEQGDHGFLLEDGTDYVGYSARLHTTAPAPLVAGENVVTTLGNGEVFLVRSLTSRGDLRFHGYSTQTGTWSTLDLGSGVPDFDVVVTEYAIGVRYTLGPRALHSIACFGARKAEWDVATELMDVVELVAEGNVVAAEVVDNFQPRFWAFSAVHNTHAFSEDLFESGSLVVDHNVAFAKTFDGASMWRGSVFSAYDATWVASDRLRPIAADAVVWIRDNVVLMGDAFLSDSPAWEAIGARPHTAWVQLDQRAGLVAGCEDAVALHGFPDDLHAFSGVAGGAWQTRPAPGPFQGHLAGERQVHVADEADVLHAFSAFRGAWATGLILPPDPLVNPGSSLTSVRNNILGSSHAWAYSARWNEWVQSPDPVGFVARNEDYILTWSAGSNVWTFDGRRNEFVSPGALGPGNVLRSDGFLLLADDDSSVSGYSTQRGTWETYAKPRGPIVFPLVEAPQVKGSVAWLVDGDHELVAIGATNDVHQWHGYPDGTEYHAFAEDGAAVAPTRVVLSIRGELGDRVRTYYAEERRFNPLNLPMAFTGKGWLQHPVVRLSNTRLTRETEAHLEFGLPTGPPANLQIWTQNLTDRASGQPTRWVAGVAPEPLCIF